MLRAEGVEEPDVAVPRQQAAFHGVLRNMARTAEDHYVRALTDLDAFALDSQVAIRACINVYRQLNQRIGASPRGIQHRESVPVSQKFKVLPASKYWRLPLAYLTR
jgi:phytoene/squalene synthetase